MYIEAVISACCTSVQRGKLPLYIIQYRLLDICIEHSVGRIPSFLMY